MSEQSPNPYGQPSPYGQQPPYGQPSPYGSAPQPTAGRRPGTVTAAAWITIAFSGITAAIFGFTGLALLVARDQVITEMERVPEFQDANVDADAAVGVLVAIMVGLVVWCVVAIVLAVLVLRRSSVARILLVISSSVTAVFSLIGIASGVSVAPLIAAIATIVLLFTGGAGAWFKGVGPDSGGYPGAPTGYPGQYDTYGQPSGTDPEGQPSGTDPYGQQSGTDPYGQQPPSGDGTDYPPRDYPNR